MTQTHQDLEKICKELDQKEAWFRKLRKDYLANKKKKITLKEVFELGQ